MNSKVNSFAMRLMCRIVFAVFTFCYLYFYQADVMVVSQHLASGGQTHYVPLAGAVLITMALLLLQAVVYKLTRLYKRTHALTYMPSVLVLIFITSISPQVSTSIDVGGWWIAFPVALAVFAVLVYLSVTYQPLTPEVKSSGFTSHVMWINLLLMFMMLLCVALFANTDEPFHRQARMEHLLTEQKVDEAIAVGQQAEQTSPSLTFVRAYALTLNRQLGEKFFETPVSPGSASLTYDSLHAHSLMLPKARVQKISRKGVDFVLTKFLLDRKLEDFATMLPKYYDLSKPLPKHYREALVVYVHVSRHPVLNFRNHQLEKEYDDFIQLRRQIKSVQADVTTGEDNARHMVLKQKYGKTYWYYYEMTA